MYRKARIFSEKNLLTRGYYHKKSILSSDFVDTHMVNVKPVKLGNTERMSFGKIDEVIDMPNLIEVQKASYKWFLEEGLKEVFRDVSGITDYQDNLVLDFIDYKLDVDHPNYSVIECKVRDATFSAALRVTARLLNIPRVCSINRQAKSKKATYSWVTSR